MNAWVRLTSHIPPEQFGRYLLVGVANTFFGYGTFAAFTALLDRRMVYGYMIALLLASVLNITVAYLGYQWFVFKTKGNYVREWMRCVAIYSSSIILGLICLPLVVFAIRHSTSYSTEAPYIGGAVIMVLGVFYSFLGHKKFSFRVPAK